MENIDIAVYSFGRKATEEFRVLISDFTYSCYNKTHYQRIVCSGVSNSIGGSASYGFVLADTEIIDETVSKIYKSYRYGLIRASRFTCLSVLEEGKELTTYNNKFVTVILVVSEYMGYGKIQLRDVYTLEKQLEERDCFILPPGVKISIVGNNMTIGLAYFKELNHIPRLLTRDFLPLNRVIISRHRRLLSEMPPIEGVLYNFSVTVDTFLGINIKFKINNEEEIEMKEVNKRYGYSYIVSAFNVSDDCYCCFLKRDALLVSRGRLFKGCQVLIKEDGRVYASIKNLGEFETDHSVRFNLDTLRIVCGVARLIVVYNHLSGLLGSEMFLYGSAYSIPKILRRS